MLFDLRGGGRRRVVKVVYVTLAFLLGGGLVLFGIGGEVSGGLVDAITERGAGSDDNTQRLEDREQEILARTRANPRDATAYAELARTRFQLAGQGDNFDAESGTFTGGGRAQLREAAAAWDRHVELAGDRPDDRVASLMVQAFSPGALDQAERAVAAQEIIAERRDTAGAYSQLAAYAYAAGQTRKGDLARDRALELTPRDMREALRGQLEQARTQSGVQGAEGAQPEATATPTATPDRE